MEEQEGTFEPLGLTTSTPSPTSSPSSFLSEKILETSAQKKSKFAEKLISKSQDDRTELYYGRAEFENATTEENTELQPRYRDYSTRKVKKDSDKKVDIFNSLESPDRQNARPVDYHILAKEEKAPAPLLSGLLPGMTKSAVASYSAPQTAANLIQPPMNSLNFASLFSHPSSVPNGNHIQPGSSHSASFNKSMTQLPENLAAVEQRRIRFKQQVSEIITKRLSKYLKNQRIQSKEDFKHLSRKLTHKIMEKEEGKYFFTPSTPKKVAQFVDSFFEKKQGVYKRKTKSSSTKETSRASPSLPGEFDLTFSGAHHA